MKVFFFGIVAIHLLFASALVAQNSGANTPAQKAQDLGDVLTNEGLWQMNIKDFRKQYADYKFQWQTEAKRSLRSMGKEITVFGEPTGEVLVKSKKGIVRYIIISLYNKGDDDEIDVDKLDSMNEKATEILAKELDEDPRTNKTKKVLHIDKSVWAKGETVYSLEKAVRNDQAEFLRLVVSSKKTARTRARAKAITKRDVRDNVVHDEASGDVYIPNVPMVDQGQKGYCACASAARIFQYYGHTVSQHEIAAIAESSADEGTSQVAMVDALKKASARFNFRVRVLYEYPKFMTSKNYDMQKWKAGQREMLRDFNSYQQLAKKNKAPGLNVGGKEYGRLSDAEDIKYMDFIYDSDPDTLRQMMIKKSSFKRWKKNIREYIDKGTPVCWSLQLGVFKEDGISQTRGGHMRLIIGYNEKKNEIIYSDSWGKGHAKKRMDAGEAFTMTNCIIAIAPSR